MSRGCQQDGTYQTAVYSSPTVKHFLYLGTMVCILALKLVSSVCSQEVTACFTLPSVARRLQARYSVRGTENWSHWALDRGCREVVCSAVPHSAKSAWHHGAQRNFLLDDFLNWSCTVCSTEFMHWSDRFLSWNFAQFLVSVSETCVYKPVADHCLAETDLDFVLFCSGSPLTLLPHCDEILNNCLDIRSPLSCHSHVYSVSRNAVDWECVCVCVREDICNCDPLSVHRLEVGLCNWLKQG